MKIFYYDRTFEGLLTAIFDAYSRKIFPDRLLKNGEIAPLFAEISHTVISSNENALRVWRGLQRKLPKNICNMLIYVWMSELEGSDALLFRYICKTFDSDCPIAGNFGDSDVLEVRNIARKVAHEALYVKQFVRFGKTADGIFFAPVSPIYNALPLTVDHFTNRFADQQWIVYDMRRKYGFYYDLRRTTEITFSDSLPHDGKPDESLMATDEKLFQDLWKNYFKALTIMERINPRLHRQNMPVRFWKYLTEKQ
ncbi:MAG: TIGR03915 family putative DNA repair protein [Prevotellaceae bacterium]|jgi:probable DNA metabolism protein|nr:TIGR03915 family putative DNA repair protein [Prevotellaceae bacterium]